MIGLTGSIGTGKSTIAKRLKELNIPVVDADVIAREIVEPKSVAYEKIVAAFGEDILHEDGTLNRGALGSIVFSDDAKRKLLNKITHPEIRKEMIKQRDEQIKAKVACVVLDIPLLFESKLTHFVDKILVVAVDSETQLKRILARDDSSEEEAKQRIASQIPIDQKVEQADAVIDNNGSVQESYHQLSQILEAWNVK